MALTDAEIRREIAHEAAIERAKRKMRFDGTVARHFLDGISVRESARLLGCTKKQISSSRDWQGLRGRRDEQDEALVEAQNQNSIEVRSFDADVLRHYSAGLDAGETAEALDCTERKVRASRAWLGLETGRNTYRSGRLTGRLTTRAALVELRGQ